jgi:holo-[acyl-carrier protein] synthase
MVIGIGVDIVEVRRVASALSGSLNMMQRVFTPAEIDHCSQRKNEYQHFAGRFAAKEAVLKALGTGWQGGIRWTDVDVIAGDAGKPEVRLHGKAKERLDESGARRVLVSITHGKEYAVAVAVLED